ncbi:hypothetical protein MJO29_000712 [Puccinia striiformis f. sp. tritici]|nr:hypothetical protein MJO29_000712 [Puccinia striiformis f. sp. tritici]
MTSCVVDIAHGKHSKRDGISEVGQTNPVRQFSNLEQRYNTRFM